MTTLVDKDGRPLSSDGKALTKEQIIRRLAQLGQATEEALASKKLSQRRWRTLVTELNQALGTLAQELDTMGW